MRCVLALMIVFVHSFTCYDSSWREPLGFEKIPIYKWLCRLAYAFALESFVFISGYLYAFKTNIQTINFKTLLKNKFTRLIIPSILFSILYYLMFYSYDGSIGMVYNIMNGCGHMWFLPMLFWCFIFIAILDSIKIKDFYKIIILFLFSLLPSFSFPLQLGRTITFMFYFYMGVVVYKHKDWIMSFITQKNIYWGWCVFLLVFVTFRPMRDLLVVSDEYSYILKLIVYVSRNLCGLLYSTIGTLILYMTTVFISQKYNLGTIVLNLAKYSFGIYIIHQFILQWLYYETSLPLILGPYWLPWCGFSFTVIVSYILSSFFFRFEMGKKLIG